jgi:DNA-binding GntR family transcriptional regulator
MTRPLGHPTIALAAADEIRRRILSETFPGGFQLRQDALANEFGVSRIPIREALLQLESEGLVRILPHRGAVVAELSTAEIEELFELRCLLEPRLLLRSAPRLEASDYEALNAVLDEYSAELRKENASRWGALNTRFHQLLYSRAEQPRTEAIVTNLLVNTDRYTRMQLSLTNGRARAEKEHAQLARLCAAGDLDGAVELLERHIRDVGEGLVGFIASRKQSSGVSKGRTNGR